MVIKNIESKTPQEIVKNNAIKDSTNMLESEIKEQGSKVDIAIPKEKDFKTLGLEIESYLNSLKDTTIANKETGMQA